MAVYNGEKYIADAINSILTQTYKNWELIVIDDGSTDQTSEIVESFNNKKIKIITNEVNMGSSCSRNIAIAQAEGKYIAILDADDIALPKRLEIQRNYIEKNPNIGLIGCQSENIDDNGDVIPEQYVDLALPFPVESIYIKWKLLWTNVIGHSTAMFKKSIFNNVNGYNESIPFSADLDLWTSMVQITDVFQIPQVLVQIRHHQSMMTVTINFEKRELEKYKACQNGFETLLNRTVSLKTVNLAVNGWQGRGPETVGEFNEMRIFIIDIYTSFKNKCFHQKKDSFKHINMDMLRTMLLWQFYYHNLTGQWKRSMSYDIVKTLGKEAFRSKQFFQQALRDSFIEKIYTYFNRIL
jgi:glycosyltransferase involved in cell wall biosynthesis